MEKKMEIRSFLSEFSFFSRHYREIKIRIDLINTSDWGMKRDEEIEKRVCMSSNGKKGLNKQGFYGAEIVRDKDSGGWEAVRSKLGRNNPQKRHTSGSQLFDPANSD